MHITKCCGPLGGVNPKSKKINNLNQLNDYELSAKNAIAQKYKFPLHVCLYVYIHKFRHLCSSFNSDLKNM